jgi:hypothetical protein
MSLFNVIMRTQVRSHEFFDMSLPLSYEIGGTHEHYDFATTVRILIFLVTNLAIASFYQINNGNHKYLATMKSRISRVQIYRE